MKIQTLFAIVSRLMDVKAHLVVVPKGGNAYALVRTQFDKIEKEKGILICVGIQTSFELSDPFVRGMFFPEYDVLMVKDQRDFFNNLAVVVHECRHAWQKQQGWEFPTVSVMDAFNHKAEVDARRFTAIVTDIVGYTSSLLVGYAIGMAIRQVMGLGKKKKEV